MGYLFREQGLQQLVVGPLLLLGAVDQVRLISDNYSYSPGDNYSYHRPLDQRPLVPDEFAQKLDLVPSGPGRVCGWSATGRSES